MREEDIDLLIKTIDLLKYTNLLDPNNLKIKSRTKYRSILHQTG